MSQDIIRIGETVSLGASVGQISRREYLKYLGGLGAGAISLSGFLSAVVGAEPEGEPLVQVMAFDGAPRQVKVIHPKRYSRLKRALDIDFEDLRQAQPGVFRLTPESLGDRPEEFGLTIHIDEKLEDKDKEAELKKRTKGLPTKFEYRKPPESGVETNAKGGSSLWNPHSSWYHTCTFIGDAQWWRDEDELLLCTAHAVEEGQDILDEEGVKIAEVVQTNESFDRAHAEIQPGIDPSKYETNFTAVDIDAGWTREGLADELDNGTIPSIGHGHTTGNFAEDAIAYEDSYQGIEAVVIFGDHVTAGGDSGAPWLEASHPNRLVAGHRGWYRWPNWWSSKKSAGIGGYAFAIGVSLDYHP